MKPLPPPDYTFLNWAIGTSSSFLAALTGQQDSISWWLATLVSLGCLHNIVRKGLSYYFKKNKNEEEEPQ